MAETKKRKGGKGDEEEITIATTEQSKKKRATKSKSKKDEASDLDEEYAEFEALEEEEDFEPASKGMPCCYLCMREAFVMATLCFSSSFVFFYLFHCALALEAS